MQQTLDTLTEKVEQEAKRLQKTEDIQQTTRAKEEEGYDGFSDEKVKLIPTPNFTDCGNLGTLLPVNMADETVNVLAKYSQEFDFVDFIKEKLNYTSRIVVCQSFKSEQLDALVMAIKSFEKDNAFILGDMAGIGKGRVCAGILRYAYQQKLIPVFLTHKPYLFNDIYRDLMDIGGFGIDKSNKIIEPKPFILHKDGSIFSEELDPITMMNIPIAEPVSPKETLRLCREVIADKSIKFPFTFTRFLGSANEYDVKFNCVFLPYSLISMTAEGSKSIDKVNFINYIAPKSIMVFDESHNAASSEGTNILERAKPLVINSKACLFSSATYAKNSSVFGLYILKTALRTAVPTLDSITDALKVGGENVSEYIATGLVKEGQMLRRERSFSNCEKITEYVGSKRIKSQIGKAGYVDIDLDETQKAFFNEAIGYFKELRDFSTSNHASKAILNAIIRKSLQKNKGVITPEQFEEAKRKTLQEQNDFIQKNLDNWVISYKQDSISRYKMTFRENLFLAIKAKFTADKVIECLTTKVDYTNTDGSQHSTPQKPLIAIRNTGEAIFDELKLKDGEELNNDFAEYLRAIYNKLFTGTFQLRKIDSNIFSTESELKSKGIDYKIQDYEFDVMADDFDSEGLTLLNDIQSKLNAYKSELPFSIIDYLKMRIEAVDRPNFYLEGNGEAKYGMANSPKFKMGEATSRNFMLQYNPTSGKYIYVKNDRERSISKVFKAFNNGAIDVMLLNVVASTGGSAQSSPKEGKDTRPRNMFVIQFELDINVEVQKRGRINRTGQINNPTYTYIVTKIPVELRTYLMFRKKLRKLDANTSADQTASSDTAELTDEKGNKIQDIVNQYGYDVFTDEFITAPANAPYKDIFEKLRSKGRRYISSSKVGKAEKDEYNMQQFLTFMNELELYPVDFQQDFFEQMNDLYIDRVENLIATNQYQLELKTKQYKASLKQRVVLQINSGTTIFSYPLFLDDYFTIDDRRAWSKDKVDEKASELANKIKQGASVQEAYAVFLKEFVADHDARKMDKINAYKVNAPKRSDYNTDEEFNDDMNKFQSNLNVLQSTQSSEYKEFLDLVNYFEPMKPIRLSGIDGVFIGYNIKDKKRIDRYAKSNVEFVFCFLYSIPVARFKYSANAEKLIGIKDYTLRYETQEIKSYDEAITSTTVAKTDQEIQAEINLRRRDFHRRVEDWKPDMTRRIVRRFLSGNILSGIVYAYQKDYSYTLTRFTEISGSVTTALEMEVDVDKISVETSTLNTSKIELSVAANNSEFVTYLKDLPISSYIDDKVLPIWNTEKPLVIESSVCITKTDISGTEFINVEILQPYRRIQDDNTKKWIIQDYQEKGRGSQYWSPMYHNTQLLAKYKKFFDIVSADRQAISYADIKGLRRSAKAKADLARKTDEARENFQVIEDSLYKSLFVYKDKYYVRMKRYVFNLDKDATELKSLLTELYNKYELCFNFRSSNVDYYNVDNQPDLFQSDMSEEEMTKKQTFPAGEYKYRFINNKVSQLEIPNIIKMTDDMGINGAILEYPLLPTRLASFNLKPYRLPYDVIIKLAISVLNDVDRADFLKKLQEEVKTKSDFEIGLFVQDFLTKRTVGTIYLFGDVAPRVIDFGKMFKEFALNKDLSELILEKDPEKEQIISAAPPKTKVTFEDAERFLMILEP